MYYLFELSNISVWFLNLNFNFLLKHIYIPFMLNIYTYKDIFDLKSFLWDTSDFNVMLDS